MNLFFFLIFNIFNNKITTFSCLVPLKLKLLQIYYFFMVAVYLPFQFSFNFIVFSLHTHTHTTGNETHFHELISKACELHEEGKRNWRLPPYHSFLIQFVMWMGSVHRTYARITFCIQSAATIIGYEWKYGVCVCVCARYKNRYVCRLN